MQRNSIFIIIGAVIIILAIGIGLYPQFNVVTSIPKYLSQSCEYDLSVYTNNPLPDSVRINSSNNPIRNITLIIPLPHRNGKPLVMNEELTPILFAKHSAETVWVNKTQPLKRAPPFNYTFIFSNGTQMVLIKGDPNSTISDFRMQFKETRNIRDDTPVHELQKTVNTLTPLGNSSVFAPEDGCIPVSALSYSYTLPVFVSYDTDASTTMTIYSSFGCRNDWAEGFRWLSNSYADHFKIDIKGPAHGWYSAKGNLTAGKGIYNSSVLKGLLDAL